MTHYEQNPVIDGRTEHGHAVVVLDDGSSAEYSDAVLTILDGPRRLLVEAETGRSIFPWAQVQQVYVKT